ncbi:MAG TPA: hypothetical protein VIY10_02935 [Solirubrobacteraceae bacterium]
MVFRSHRNASRRRRAPGAVVGCRCLLLALIATAALAAAPIAGGGHPVPGPRTARRPQAQAAPATSRFGISGDYLAAAATPAGRQFASEVLGPRGRVRFFVPYDARGSFDGTACAPSPAYTAGATAWNTLLGQLRQARADGLVAQITFAVGTGVGGTPTVPDPADPAQAGDYACGVNLALQALWAARQTTGMPVDVEAWNEPDQTPGLAAAPTGGPGSCPASTTEPAACSGAWRAAMLWYLAQTQANALHQTVPGFPMVTMAALTLGAPEKLSYLDAGHASLADPRATPYPGYYQSLYEIVHCARGYGGCVQPGVNPTAMPTDWAVHDYTDPTAQGTADLRGFVTTLAQLNDRYAAGAAAHVWVTESGVHLDSGTRRDANHPDGVTCHTAEAAEAADAADDTFGCLVDGNPAAQALGGQVWRELAGVAAPTAHGVVGVTQLFWYQFALGATTCTASAPCQLADGVVYVGGQSLPTLHSWDSALVDSGGRPRASFCALTGRPASNCPGQPDAYADAHWVEWWQPMPAQCPAHEGAWVADRPDSGVPGGQECYYSPAQPPPATRTADSGANGTA